MTKGRFWQVDAFASRPFTGNPAAVMILEEWWPDELLQAIAVENNLSETAYLIRRGQDHGHLRWFTPGMEVRLCGHATLATAHILWSEGFFDGSRFTFEALSGPLVAERQDDGIYAIEFASDPPAPAPQYAALLSDALNAEVIETLAGQYLLAHLPSAEAVRTCTPDFRALAALEQQEGLDGNSACVVVTAPGDGEHDFICRFFGPTVGIDEDPVTGSAFTMLAPYWAQVLGRTELSGHQASARGGDVGCAVHGERVQLTGQALTYAAGTISEAFLPG